MGFFSRDRSDARDNPGVDSPSGSGVGFAPVGADARDSGAAEGIPIMPYDLNPSYGPADLRDDDLWPLTAGSRLGDTRPLGDNQAPHGSGAQSGSPELEYLAMEEAGYYPVDVGPLDGGLNDPIRRGYTPVRAAVTRFLFTRVRWGEPIAGEYGREREIIGQDSRGAQQPRGRMSPMDEYRLLGDGYHA